MIQVLLEMLYAGLQPFIVTLTGLLLYRTLALIYTGGNPIFGLPNEFRARFNGAVFGVPVSVVLVGTLALLAWVVLNRSVFGEHILAVGGNREAAHVAGVPVKRTNLGVYMISGALASTTALILTGRLGATEPTMGVLWELDAIAAAAIGGASLMGGP